MQGQESYSSRQKLPLEGGSGTGVVLQAFLCQLRTQIDSWDGKISPDLVEICTMLETQISHTQPKHLEPLVNIVFQLIKRGCPSNFLCKDLVFKRLTSYYNTLCNQLQKLSISTRSQQEPSKLQFKMISILSLISQLINEHPSFQFHFSKRFSQNIFMLSFQLVQMSTRRKEILRILSVLFYALSKQAKILKQFELFPRLRSSLLQNYHLIEDLRTVDRFNKALKIIVKDSPLTFSQIKKFKIAETLKSFNRPSEECKQSKLDDPSDAKGVIIVPRLIRLGFSNNN